MFPTSKNSSNKNISSLKNALSMVATTIVKEFFEKECDSCNLGNAMMAHDELEQRNNYCKMTNLFIEGNTLKK